MVAKNDRRSIEICVELGTDVGSVVYVQYYASKTWNLEFDTAGIKKTNDIQITFQCAYRIGLNWTSPLSLIHSSHPSIKPWQKAVA